MTDEAFMAEALREAEAGLAVGEVPIGSIVVRDGLVLARRHWVRARDLLAHPEVEVLRGIDARGATLYTTLEPCVMCMGAAMSSFVRRVVFGLESRSDGARDIPALYRDRLPASGRPWSLPAVVGGVGRTDSLRLVERYLENGPPGPLTAWARTLV